MSDSEDTRPDGAAEDGFESQLDAIRIRLQSFEGPLDLLVHLIKKNQVNVYDIPIALITKQYLEYLDLMQELNLDVASEFLVMAATLIHIKSRTLLPRPDPAQEDQVEEEDPRDALVRRLLEHQKFKAAAELLHERETLRSAQWARPDSRIEAIAGEEFEPELEVDLFSLLGAFRKVLERTRERPPVPLPPEELSVEARIEQLLDRLSETEACGFDDLFEDVATREDMIVTFLALLEMIRLKLIRAFQSGAFGPIRLYKRARPQDAPHPIHDPEDEYRTHHPAHADAASADGAGASSHEGHEAHEEDEVLEAPGPVQAEPVAPAESAGTSSHEAHEGHEVGQASDLVQQETEEHAGTSSHEGHEAHEGNEVLEAPGSAQAEPAVPAEFAGTSRHEAHEAHEALEEASGFSWEVGPGPAPEEEPAAENSAVEDTAAENTAAEDTAVEDTAVEHAAMEQAPVEDVEDQAHYPAFETADRHEAERVLAHEAAEPRPSEDGERQDFGSASTHGEAATGEALVDEDAARAGWELEPMVEPLGAEAPDGAVEDEAEGEPDKGPGE